jgi:hypothetical protein
METAKRILDNCNALAHVFHEDIDRILDFASIVAEAISAHYGPKSLRPPTNYTNEDAANLKKICDTLSCLLVSEVHERPNKEEIVVTEQSLKSFRAIVKALDRARMPSMGHEMALVYMQSTLEAFLKAYIEEAPIPPMKEFSGTSFGSLLDYLKKNMAIDLVNAFSQYPTLSEAVAYRNAYVHNHGKPDARFFKQVKSYSLENGRLMCSYNFVKHTAQCAHAMIDFIQFNLGRLYLLQITSPGQTRTPSLIDPWEWKGLEHAEETMGKSMVVQVTFYSSSGQELEQFMTYGKITAVADDGTLTLTTPCGEPYAVPFDPKSIKLAPPGIYTDTRLGSTIVDPELLTVWQARSPDDDPAKLDECKRNGFPGARRTELTNKTDAGDT